MWFRRRRRQPPLDLSSFERSLDRLAELVERIVALIPEVIATRDAGRPISPAPAAPAVEPAPNPAPEPQPGERQRGEPQPDEPQADGFVVFVGGPSGYRLLERDGAPPARGADLELDGERYVVLRQGPSPLPGDRRRCAFLEREERPRPDRTAAGEGTAG